MGLIILFTYLKIILLSYFLFQFSISASINLIQTILYIHHPPYTFLFSDVMVLKIEWVVRRFGLRKMGKVRGRG